MIIAAFLISLLAQDGMVRTGGSERELTFSQTIEASCDDDRLTIRDFGAGLSPRAAPVIAFNGSPIVGDALARMSEDLAQPWAVYRFQIHCTRSGFAVRLGRGEGRAPQTEYQESYALIEDGRLIIYEPLQDVAEQLFWF